MSNTKGMLFKFHSIKFDEDGYSRVIESIKNLTFYAPTLDKMNDKREGFIARFLILKLKESLINGNYKFKFIDEMCLDLFTDVANLEIEMEELYNSLETPEYSNPLGKDRKLTGKINSILDEIHEKIFLKKGGVYCLSTKNKSLNHWDRYTDSNSGICLAYDYELLMQNFTEESGVSYGKMVYEKIEDIRKDVIDDIKQLSKKELIKHALFTKTDDWAYESEFRIIFPKDGSQKFNSQALKIIYFGDNMSERKKNKIMDEIRRVDDLNHVKFKVFRLDEFGEVQFDEIK